MFNRVNREKKFFPRKSLSSRESGSPENPSVFTLVIAQILIIAQSLLSTPMFREQKDTLGNIEAMPGTDVVRLYIISRLS